MSLIKHHDRLLGQLFGHQISYLGVQQVVIAVNHNVGMQDLWGNKDKERETLKDGVKTIVSNIWTVLTRNIYRLHCKPLWFCVKFLKCAEMKTHLLCFQSYSTINPSSNRFSQILGKYFSHQVAYFMFAAVCRETYRVSCQIIRTPAFPPAKVFQVVEVVDPGRKRHLSADWVKLLHTNMWDRGGSRRLQTYTQTYSLMLTTKQENQYYPQRGVSWSELDECRWLLTS